MYAVERWSETCNPKFVCCTVGEGGANICSEKGVPKDLRPDQPHEHLEKYMDCLLAAHPAYQPKFVGLPRLRGVDWRGGREHVASGAEDDEDLSEANLDSPAASVDGGRSSSTSAQQQQDINIGCLVATGVFVKCADDDPRPPGLEEKDWRDWNAISLSPPVTVGIRKPKCDVCEKLKISQSAEQILKGAGCGGGGGKTAVDEKTDEGFGERGEGRLWKEGTVGSGGSDGGASGNKNLFLLQRGLVDQRRAGEVAAWSTMLTQDADEGRGRGLSLPRVLGPAFLPFGVGGLAGVGGGTPGIAPADLFGKRPAGAWSIGAQF